MTEVPTDTALVQVVITVIQFPQGYLLAEYLIARVQHGVLLQDGYDILPVHPIKLVPKYDYGEGRLRAPWKGALKFANVPGENNLIDLGEVFVLV